MHHSFIKGASSLLFIFSAIKALYSSNLVFWKIGNTILIPTSYLCNAYNYEPTFMLYDYITIFVICLSYINNCYANSIFILSSLLEKKYFNSIENTKNIAFGTAMAMSVANTYIYVDNFHYYIILTSSISGITIYKIRYVLIEQYKMQNTIYNILLSWLFHICVMNIMYVSSITAV
jgi:hypothetical protein